MPPETRMSEPVFVGREPELAQLGACLERTLAGQAQIALVAGEAGSGKTALLHEFARRAQERDAGLIVVIGNCNAQTGLGDPNLPFREVLRLLTGDVEADLANNVVNAENAYRLRGALVHSVQVLVEISPDVTALLLAGIPGAGLLARAAAPLAKKAGWMDKLEKLAKRPAAAPVDPNLEPSRILEQYTHALQALAAQHPPMKKASPCGSRRNRSQRRTWPPHRTPWILPRPRLPPACSTTSRVPRRSTRDR
jgi:predicted ATPase